MAAAGQDGSRQVVSWRAKSSVCAVRMSRSRRFPGRRDLRLLSLFLVSAGFYTAPLINTFGRLHWAGDNPGANLFGFIVGSTFFVIVFLRVPGPHRTEPVLVDDDKPLRFGAP